MSIDSLRCILPQAKLSHIPSDRHTSHLTLKNVVVRESYVGDRSSIANVFYLSYSLLEPGSQLCPGPIEPGFPKCTNTRNISNIIISLACLESSSRTHRQFPKPRPQKGHCSTNSGTKSTSATILMHTSMTNAFETSAWLSSPLTTMCINGG